jgi:hypothetical protein
MVHMKKHHICAALTLAVLVCAAVQAEKGEAIKSGPQVDAKLTKPFHPLNVTGDKAGEKNCLFCSNGNNPVAMIFAREATPAVATLIKKIDEATVKNKGCDMGSFVVFCSNEEGLEKKLKELAEKEKLSKIVLSIDNPAGPQGYDVSKDADVTVVLYTGRVVKANFAFKKGQLSDKKIDAIVSDVSKITPKN